MHGTLTFETYTQTSQGRVALSHMHETRVSKGSAPVGRLIRMPSPVGSRVRPWPIVASGGSCRVVSRVLARSCSSGSSHCAMLGITMPTLGKLPK